ncbi:hypothetical protein D3C71_1539400 [compost metagenome]
MVWPSGTSIAASLPNSAASVSENAVARNQVPIIRLTTRGAASWVTADKPTGDRHISPISRIRYASTSHHTLAICPVAPTCWAASAKGTNDSAAKISPIEDLIGLDGSIRRRSSHAHSIANSGASTTRNRPPR